MTPTKTTLPPEIIRQSSKLQKIGRTIECKNCGTYGSVNKKQFSCEHITCEPCGGTGYIFENTVTIADIIDNAEELFGKDENKKLYCENCSFWQMPILNFENITFEIIDMCQQNKSIQEISKYIIKNIK